MVREAAEDTVLEIPNKPHGQVGTATISGLRKVVQVSCLFIKKKIFFFYVCFIFNVLMSTTGYR